MTTEKENSINITLLGIIKGVLAFMLVTLSLFHVFFQAKPDAISENNEKYTNEIDRRNTLQSTYLESLKTGKLSVDDYYIKTTELLETSEKNVDLINKEKRQINIGHSFLGRSSLHFWLFVFGLVTALFYFSSKSLFDEVSRGSTFKHHLVSFSGIIVSGFWFIHLFFLTQKDFNNNKYIGVLVVCGLLFAVFTYFLIKYYTYKDQIIYKLINFTKKVKTVYIHDLALRAKYSENTKQTLPKSYTYSVDDTIDRFQKDLKEITSDL